ncbi:MAG: mechanosensitive ion channel [Verrucomicrobiae bacterium]|nr:mechanosensitive ion channel [Verrucomicrobiae bacterium]
MKVYRLALSLLLFAFSLDPVLAQEETADGNIPENITIEAEATESDAAIKRRLETIFDQIDELQDVSVEVASGVVTLSGLVPNARAGDEAIALTKKTAGVIYVRDRIDQNVEVSTRLRPAVDKINELRTTGIQKLPILGIALLIVVVSWFLGTWLSNRKSWYARLRINDMSAHLLRRFIKLLVIGLGIYSALEILDVTALAGAIIGVAGVAGIALGFAFRNIVENYLAGILLSMRNPFSTGDVVEIDGFQGKVVRLTSRDTVLMTFDGNHLRIPNSKIITSVLINYTRNPLRRFDFVIGVSNDLDLVAVRKLGIEILQSLKSSLEDPGPNIVIEALGDSTVNLRFFAWIDQRVSDYRKSKSEAIRLVKDAFDKAHFDMPEPTYRVHLKDSGSLAKKPESTTETQQPHVTRSPKSEEQDTAADTTIDEQVEAAQDKDNEANLLEEK